MPFTFAHPAAAVPLARHLGRYGCTSALVIGSMTPDLPFFLGIQMARPDTHGLPALVTWALPAGLMLYALFQLLFKQALMALMPPAISTRLTVTAAGQPTLLAVVMSLLCGAGTHLLWDAFTHPGTFVTENLPLLQTRLGNIGLYKLYAYKLLQHVSTAAGLSLLAFWIWRWWARTALSIPVSPVLSAPVRCGICCILILLPLAAGAWNAWSDGWSLDRMAIFVFTTLPTFFWMVTAYALVWRLAGWRNSRIPD